MATGNRRSPEVQSEREEETPQGLLASGCSAVNLIYERVFTCNMRGSLFVMLFSITGSVMAQLGYSSFGEAFSLRVGQESLEVSYRQHTAPSLTEFAGKRVLVDWVDVYPTEIRIAVGESYSLSQLQVTTFSPDGGIAKHVPLSLDLEGPPDLLDFEAWRIESDSVVGATAGTGTIWVVSHAPSSTGEYLKQPVLLVVY